MDGLERDNTGGTVIFLSPGTQFVGGRCWLVEVSFQFPRPNGLQLGTTWTRTDQFPSLRIQRKRMAAQLTKRM